MWSFEIFHSHKICRKQSPIMMTLGAYSTMFERTYTDRLLDVFSRSLQLSGKLLQKKCFQIYRRVFVIGITLATAEFIVKTILK